MKANKLFITALVIILGINVLLLFKISHLNNRIENLTYSLNNLQSGLSFVTADVNQTLSNFTREQSWITPVELDYEKSRINNNQLEVVCHWQIKELAEGSQIMFYYSRSEAEDFKGLAAIRTGEGLYEARFPVEMTPEPDWSIGISRTEERGAAQAEAIHALPANEIKSGQEANQPLRCYVAVKANGVTKSSEISYLSLNDVLYKQFGAIDGHIHIDKNHFSIRLFARNFTRNFTQPQFESMTAEFYTAGNAVKIVPLEEYSEDLEPTQHFRLDYDAGESITHLVIKVNYENGKTFSREIF